MWDHLASQFDGATFVHGGNVGDDVVLGRLDRRFSCIGVVVVSFHVLSHGVLYLQKLLTVREHSSLRRWSLDLCPIASRSA